MINTEEEYEKGVNKSYETGCKIKERPNKN